MATQNGATLPASTGKSGIGDSPTGPAGSGHLAADHIDEFTAGAGVNIGNNTAVTGTLSASGAFTPTGGIGTVPGAILSSTPAGGVGYAAGAGGTVTQITSKATGVALNTLSGAITLNNAALNAGVVVSFTLTDTSIAATDVMILNHDSGGTVGAYLLNAQCGAGSALITVTNISAANLSEAIVIQFAVIKGVNA
jgi:hypothetical protein